jgi:nucleotide-binding universal stress UspA family protein
MNRDSLNLSESAALQLERLEHATLDADLAVYRRALIPLDGSDAAETIIPAFMRIVRALGLELVLLRVVPVVPPQVVEGSSRPVVVDNQERLQQEAQAYLTTIAGRYCGDLRVVTAVRTGDAVTEILAAVPAYGTDLIAMTTHGRGGLSRLLFGSVAEGVLRRASVPLFFKRISEAEGASKAA